MSTTTKVSKDMIERYFDLSKMKKEIESEMNQLKDAFHIYFDSAVGSNKKGEVLEGKYKLQRQIRKTEKFQEEDTVNRLEELKLNDLIKVVKKPDDAKIKGAIDLGLLEENDLEGCRVVSYSKVIVVREV
ncbi:hypothetical protein [Oceanobacillus bengalensis]|uniref:Uncharacterized protein n=1 Tax=Oceanobacillus bengalensis TaxID=1435466 RepID=A0A494YTM9_9BACI|nr:hypothetical protein [Oceanobacillus bengalensis]RKQ13489.1 hypothetical protein D8M05_16075 [Oceanobacillus bengalensis]